MLLDLARDALLEVLNRCAVADVLSVATTCASLRYVADDEAFWCDLARRKWGDCVLELAPLAARDAAADAPARGEGSAPLAGGGSGPGKGAARGKRKGGKDDAAQPSDVDVGPPNETAAAAGGARGGGAPRSCAAAAVVAGVLAPEGPATGGTTGGLAAAGGAAGPMAAQLFSWKAYAIKRMNLKSIRRSPIALGQERFSDPWQHITCCILFSRTSGSEVIASAIDRFFALFPTPSAVLSAPDDAVCAVIRPLGLQPYRLRAARSIARDFLATDWAEPSDFYGCGKFVADSWRIFCRGDVSGASIEDRNLRAYVSWAQRAARGGGESGGPDDLAGGGDQSEGAQRRDEAAATKRALRAALRAAGQAAAGRGGGGGSKAAAGKGAAASERRRTRASGDRGKDAGCGGDDDAPLGKRLRRCGSAGNRP